MFFKERKGPKSAIFDGGHADTPQRIFQELDLILQKNPRNKNCLFYKLEVLFSCTASTEVNELIQVEV